MCDTWKVKLKDLFKTVVRFEPIHSFICFIFFLYVNFTYKTSKKIFKGKYLEARDFINQGKSVLLCTWHNRILVSPAMIIDLTKGTKKKKLGVLASRHKDGQLASKTIGLFGFKEIFGSSADKTKGKSKGGIGAIRSLIKELKLGRSFCIAPDGPRGPMRKNNSEIVSISKITGAPIFPVSLSCSKKISLDTWDKFQVFIPFSKIIIEFGEPINVKRSDNTKKLDKKLEKELNKLINKNDKAVKL